MLPRKLPKVDLSFSKNLLLCTSMKVLYEWWKILFYFMLKAFSVLEIFAFLSWLFGYLEKRLDKKAMVSFKYYDVTDWTTNNYNTHIAKYLKK